MMYHPRKRLIEWAEENPTINPFSECYNITNLGGAELYWEEFKYRYGERQIYYEAGFVNAVKRVFNIYKYKYERLLATTLATYNMFDNYKLAKAGSEKTSYDVDKSHSGTDEYTKGTTSTITDGITVTTTTTPGVQTTVTETPGAKMKETVTPQTTEIVEVANMHKIKETTEKGIEKTITTTPESYTDSTSRTTYDDTTYQPVSQIVHSAGANPGEVTESYDDGQDTKTTEFLTDQQGHPYKDTTTTSFQNGSKVETVVELLDNTNNTTVTSKTGIDTVGEVHSGTKSNAMTGKDSITHGLKVSTDGDETLSFEDRVDSGYMYREPQNAIKDERDIAVFAILDVILSDVERVTLLSVY